MKTMPDPLNDPRFEHLVSQLRGQAAPEPSADFTDRTMDRIHRAPVRRWTFSEIAVRAAAAFALLLGAGLWWVRIPAPVASAPVGFGPAGLPMGMQLAGPPRGDFAVLALVRALEAVAPWTGQHPPAATERA